MHRQGRQGSGGSSTLHGALLAASCSPDPGSNSQAAAAQAASTLLTPPAPYSFLNPPPCSSPSQCASAPPESPAAALCACRHPPAWIRAARTTLLCRRPSSAPTSASWASRCGDIDGTLGNAQPHLATSRPHQQDNWTLGPSCVLAGGARAHFGTWCRDSDQRPSGYSH